MVSFVQSAQAAPCPVRVGRDGRDSGGGTFLKLAMAGRAGELARVVPAALPQFALVPEVTAPAATPVTEPTVSAAPVLAEAPTTLAPVAEAPAATPEAAGARVVMSAAKLPFLLFGN